jgi:hypothetical protein
MRTEFKITILVKSLDADDSDVYAAVEENLETLFEGMRNSMSDGESSYEVVYSDDSGEGLTVEEILE